MPGVLEVRLRHDGHVAEARRGGRGDADAGDLPDEDGKQQIANSPHTTLQVGCRLLKLNDGWTAGLDPVQRLQRDVERAVPRAGAEVPRVQLLQHPGDEGRPGARRALQSLSRGPRHKRRGGSFEAQSVHVHQVHHGRGCS